MLIGMAFSATFSNMVSEQRLEQIRKGFNPILSVAMIIVILNLGAPLDLSFDFWRWPVYVNYHPVPCPWKILWRLFRRRRHPNPHKTVRNFLGLTLLPHSGVSLVFTGIAVSVLTGPAPECARIIQGTIAAALLSMRLSQ